MAEVYGETGFFYEYVDDWGKLPEGMSFLECQGEAVDSKATTPSNSMVHLLPCMVPLTTLSPRPVSAKS